MPVSAHGGVTILVVDDHPVVRQGMAAMFAAEDWPGRVLEAGTIAQARRLATLERPGIAIVDLTLPDGDGVTLVRELAARTPPCAVVVVTMTHDVGVVHSALDAGARGYVLKDAAPETLVAAVRTVAAGGRVLGPGVDEADPRGGARRSPTPLDALTPRERRLLRLFARGHSNREIAAELTISEKTVRNQISLITTKLGVADRLQAALLAHKSGLTD